MLVRQVWQHANALFVFLTPKVNCITHAATPGDMGILLAQAQNEAWHRFHIYCAAKTPGVRGDALSANLPHTTMNKASVLNHQTRISVEMGAVGWPADGPRSPSSRPRTSGPFYDP
jgi:1,2-phenylacetyl-CoA epoxidase catalytic subunit